MKLRKIVILIFLTTLAIAYFSWAQYYAGDFMDLKTAEKKWKVSAFNKELFRKTAPEKRAPMAVDIVMRQVYVGEDMLKVREELGSPDSYFFSDTIYAYKIMAFPGENEENWHLVFIPDEKLEKVKEVRIHKKCCYKTPLD